MKDAQLYFLSDQYYIDFPDRKLMQNKDMIDGRPHDRPCFLAFADAQNSDIYWIVPLSSRVDKYKRIADEKIRQRGFCNTIRFGEVLGRQSAFLIQNMCPVTAQYLIEYVNKQNTPIRIDERIAADVIRYAKQVLNLHHKGAKVIFPDVDTIYAHLDQTT